MQMMAIPGPVLQAVVEYLAKRPWDEVYKIIPALLQLQPVAPEKSESSEASDNPTA